MAESKDSTLMYKGRPLVRCGDTVFYGNPDEPYMIKLTVNSKKALKDISLSESVGVFLLEADPSKANGYYVTKKSEKNGIFNALDLGEVWLTRALKK